MLQDMTQVHGQIRIWRLYLLIVLGACAAAGCLILLLGPITTWAIPTKDLSGVEEFNALNATRQTLLAGTGGIVVLAGGIFTARTYYLSRRGQLTDRYAKAIALLASDKITERVGGIYALEHLMIESEQEHATVIEVLAAYIREQTGAAAANAISWDAEHHHVGDTYPRISTDVQAALTVIGRRPQRSERNEVDLSLTDFCGSDLSRLNFDGVWFWRARLQNAKMLDTSMKGANLAWAQMQGAMLTDAQLQGAYLCEARLQEAVLIRAKLQHADLEEAHLEGAFLGGANLSATILKRAKLQGTDLIAFPIGRPLLPVRGLTMSQLAEAEIDDTTRLPDHLRPIGGTIATLPNDETAGGQ